MFTFFTLSYPLYDNLSLHSKVSKTTKVRAFKRVCPGFPGVKFDSNFCFFRDGYVNSILINLETMFRIQALYFQNNMSALFDQNDIGRIFISFCSHTDLLMNWCIRWHSFQGLVFFYIGTSREYNETEK